MSTPADRGWGPGWPNAQTSKIVTIRRSDGVVLPVRREVVQMVIWLCNETERRGYNLRPGECWGFANRPIRGTNRASNHSWGLAVDLNAPANPMTDRLITDMPSWMPKLWGEHGWHWGGHYRSRPDAMHYEYMGSLAKAVAWRAPSTHEPTNEQDDDMTGDQAAQLIAVKNYAVSTHEHLLAVEGKANDAVNYAVDAQNRLVSVESKLNEVLAKLND